MNTKLLAHQLRYVYMIVIIITLAQENVFNMETLSLFNLKCIPIASTSNIAVLFFLFLYF